ncbi:MAG: hypothetical protein J5677_00140 [Bacteroidales bacterium]|nr:hypothetical protein [Bacteroidales bacterium]
MGTESFLYEDDSELIIPTDGQYIRIYYQDDGTTTVMDTGGQQFVLNGRYMRMEHYSSLEAMAGLIVQEPSELHSALADAIQLNGLDGENEQYRNYSPQNKGCSTDNPFVIMNDKHYVRLEYAIMTILFKWYPDRKEYITLAEQAILHENGRYYDLLRYIVTLENETHFEDYYFDITNHISVEE